jgi:hypothetical protein
MDLERQARHTSYLVGLGQEKMNIYQFVRWSSYFPTLCSYRLALIPRSRGFPPLDIRVLDPHCPSNLLSSDTLTPIGSSEPTHKTLLGALRSHSSNCLGKFTLTRSQSHLTPAPMIDSPAASREGKG